MNSPQPTFCVMGAGAVGSLFGGFLAARGFDVALVGRQAHIDAIRQDGLELTDATGRWGQHHATRFADLLTDIRDRSRAVYDVFFLTTRATETHDAIRQLSPALAPDALIISIQNGIGNWETVADCVGWKHVVGGVLNTGVQIPSPGHAHVTVQGFPPMIGRPPHDEAPPAERVEQLGKILQSTGMPVEVSLDIRAVQWRKLIYNCCLNPLATLKEGKYGVLMGDPEAERDQTVIIEECYAVAEAHGIGLDIPNPSEYRRWFYEDVFPPTANHEPSMLAHLRAGKHTEIDSLNGAIVDLGNQAGIPTPVNSRYTKRIRDLEARMLGPVQR